MAIAEEYNVSLSFLERFKELYFDCLEYRINCAKSIENAHQFKETLIALALCIEARHKNQMASRLITRMERIPLTVKGMKELKKLHQKLNYMIAQNNLFNIYNYEDSEMGGMPF